MRRAGFTGAKAPVYDCAGTEVPAYPYAADSGACSKIRTLSLMAAPVPALRFAAHLPAYGPVRVELSPAALGDARRSAADSGAAAYVIRSRDLDDFRALRELVVDRGRKLEKKELAALLLGHDKAPLIAGSYKSSGQLHRSVRTLLTRAAARADGNIFIIGVADRIFEELWAKPGAELPLSDADAILKLLPPAKVPDDLSQKFIGVSPQAKLVRRLILRAAEQESPVLIQGDTGTGKEIVARAIHEYGRRRVEMFVPVNCAAIPPDLFESELFGHEPQAFTGAVHRKPGLWRTADRGTLFLDEIGDLRPDHQAKILRTLQEGAVRPVGGVEINVRARVIMATHRDLAALVKEGRFREDLYYRLQSFFIPTPSLESYPEDIPLLAQAFWKAIARDPHATLSETVIAALAARPWPGNARELKAVLSHLHALFGARGISMEHLNAVSRLQSGLMKKKN